MTVEEYFECLDKRYSVTEDLALYGENGTVRACVINPFTADLENYMNVCVSGGRIPTVLYSDHMSGEMLSVNDNQLENYKDLAASYPIAQKILTIEKEIAMYRNMLMTGIHEVMPMDPELTKILFIEYMLKTFVCYVECFNAMGTVHKYIGTRNVSLLSKLVPGLENNEVKVKALKTGLTLRYEDMQNGSLSFYPLKVDKKAEKNGLLRFSDVGRKASVFTIGNIIRVMPISLCSNLARHLLVDTNMMSTDYVQVVYLKDSGTLRSIISTVNADKITAIYKDVDLTKKLMNSCKVAWDRGYISVPDLTLSRNQAVDDGCRAINISRLIRINTLPNYVNEYVDKDISGTLNTFTNYLNINVDNFEWLKRVCTELEIDTSTVIQGHLDNAYALATFIRNTVTKAFEKDAHGYGIKLHNYMLKYAAEFGGYTGDL